jgi:hypothetical protein
MDEDSVQAENIEVLQLFHKFLCADKSAGQQLLTLTAKGIDENTICDACFQTIKLVISEGEEECKEIAVSIVANLVLCTKTCHVAVEKLNLPSYVVENLFSFEDPFVMSEFLRVLTNISFSAFSSSLNEHYLAIIEVSSFALINSRCPKLLAQASQLLYYLQIQNNSKWMHAWSPMSFFNDFFGSMFQDLFVDFEQERDRSTLPNADVHRETVLLARVCLAEVALCTFITDLQAAPMNGDCTGLEWFLFMLDANTRSNFDKATGAAQVLRSAKKAQFLRNITHFCVALLLLNSHWYESHRSSHGDSCGWDDSPGNGLGSFDAFDAVKSSSCILSLLPNESFVVCSILENVLFCSSEGVELEAKSLLPSEIIKAEAPVILCLSSKAELVVAPSCVGEGVEVGRGGGCSASSSPRNDASPAPTIMQIVPTTTAPTVVQTNHCRLALAVDPQDVSLQTLLSSCQWHAALRSSGSETHNNNSNNNNNKSSNSDYKSGKILASSTEQRNKNDAGHRGDACCVLLYVLATTAEEALLRRDAPTLCSISYILTRTQALFSPQTQETTQNESSKLFAAFRTLLNLLHYKETTQWLENASKVFGDSRESIILIGKIFTAYMQPSVGL